MRGSTSAAAPLPPEPEAGVLAQTVRFPRDPLAYFPFGAGARHCVGEPLARAEIATVVPAFLAAAHLEPVASAPERMVQRATVLVPQWGLLVRAQRSASGLRGPGPG